jgi:integrase
VAPRKASDSPEVLFGQERRLDCVLIFHRDGKPVGDFRKVWARACRLAGVSGKLIYDLRRTAVRNMVRAGVDPAVAMKISGHRTRNVFDRYNIISEDDIRQAVLKTDAYVESLPTTSPLLTLHSAAMGQQRYIARRTRTKYGQSAL